MAEKAQETVWMRLWFQDMDCLKYLNDAEYRQVIHALRVLAVTGEDTPLEGAARMAYSFMANRVRQDCEAYRKTCERNRANGNKRKASGTQWEPVDASGAEVRSKKIEVRSEKIEDNHISLPHSGSSKPSKKPHQDPETEGRFDNFWREYPRKEAKQEARKAFFSLSPDEVTFARMLEAVKRQKSSDQWRDKQYIPHPATWIRGKRWEDEASSPAPNLCANLKGVIVL